MGNKIYFYTKEKLIDKLSKLEYITKLLENNLSNRFNKSKDSIKYTSFKMLYQKYLRLLNLKDAFIKFLALKIELELIHKKEKHHNICGVYFLTILYQLF